MKTYNVLDKKTGKVIATQVRVAENFYTRLKGLMFTPEIEGGGLLLLPCNSIHTCFMNYAIDAVFLDRENKIIKVKRNLLPWRITALYWSAYKVLELNANTFPSEINEGEILEVICLS